MPPIPSIRERLCRRPSSSGMSLIELLVTIAVVATLAMIVTTIMPSVHNRSSMTVCTSNLRGIGQGIYLYASENGGEAPAGAELGGMKNWYHALEPYMGAQVTEVDSPERPKWQQCPAKHFAQKERRNIGYGWNYQNFGSTERSPAHGWRTVLATVEEPSSTIICGCSPDLEVSEGRPFMNIYIYDQRFPENHARRHNGGGNYLMVDGSVAFYKAEDLMEALPLIYKIRKQ